MGASQPFMYGAQCRDPATAFDPKSITRASWEPRLKKGHPRGPFISLNRHPDSHVVLASRTDACLSLGSCAIKWIKCVRQLQLALRILQLNGAVGVLILMILIINMEAATAWVLRITPGISIIHSLYAIYHLAHGAARRTPASSAAYQAFAAVTDLCVVCIYAYGAFSVHQNGGSWATVLPNRNLMRLFISAVYYILIGSGALHLISASKSLWLCFMFRRISLMPPDMNPLEDNMTAQSYHKINKSATPTGSSVEEYPRPPSAATAGNAPNQRHDDGSQPPIIPFMYTRAGSGFSEAWTNPEIAAANAQRAAVTEKLAQRSHTTNANTVFTPRGYQCGSYTELRTENFGWPFRPGSSSVSRHAGRGKHIETWLPTDSSISTTNTRRWNSPTLKGPHQAPSVKHYPGLPQRYGSGDTSESEERGDDDPGYEMSKLIHSDPMEAHPALRLKNRPTTDKRLHSPKVVTKFQESDQDLNLEKRVGQLLKDSHAENDFSSKSYQEPRCAMPPIMLDSSRKVSSGNDYKSAHNVFPYERRIASYRQAEREGNLP